MIKSSSPSPFQSPKGIDMIRSIQIPAMIVLMMIAFAGKGWSQTSVFADDFNRLAVSPGGIPEMTYTTTTTGAGVPIIESSLVTGTVPYLKIANGTPAGRSYVTGSVSTFGAPFNSTLSSNTGLVTWSFNIRHSRGGGTVTTLSGFAAASYGIAAVLAATDANLLNTGCNGYAVVMGAPSSGNVYNLVKFTNGLTANANFTTLVTGTMPTSTAPNNLRDYMSIMVTYDPITNVWKLYERIDGLSAAPAWADPLTINASNLIGQATDNTYTSSLMNAFGYFWNYSTSAGINAFFDNFNVSVTPVITPTISVVPSSLSGFTYVVGSGPSVSKPFSVSGVNLTGFPNNVTVTGSSNYEVSTDNSTFAPTVNVAYNSATLASTIIHVRLKAGLSVGNYNSELVACSGGGAPVVNITCSGFVLSVPITYTWTGSTDNDWQVASNWSPSRSTPAINDILQFNNGGTYNVTNVPTQTIAQLLVSAGSKITLQAAASATLTVAGESGDDLNVSAGGSELNASGAIPLVIALNTEASGLVHGTMNFSGGAHIIKSTDANSLVFASGSIFKATTGFTGNAFGTTNLNSVKFLSGSTYIQDAGSNPFGAGQPASVLIFETGSLYKFTAASGGPSYSGRTYADFENDSPLTTQNNQGSSPMTCNNYTVTSGIVNWDFSGGVVIKGNIVVSAAATLTFGNAVNLTNLTLSGTAAQIIGGTGAILFGANSTLTINNAAGVTLNNPYTVNNLTLTNGIISTGTNTLTVNAAINNGSATSYVNGKLARLFAAAASKVFPIGKGGNYRPLSINYTALDAPSTVVAEQLEQALVGALPPGTTLYTSRIWNVTQTGGATFTYDITLDGTGFSPVATPVILKEDAGTIVSYGTAGAPPAYTATGMTSFSNFALGDFAVTPEIIATGSLAAFNAIVGVPSAEQSYTVSGSNLVAGLIVTPPTGFEVSTSSGGGFGTTLTLTPVSGTVANTTIYVRFNPASGGLFSGNISNSSAGASTMNVAVTGTASVPTIITAPASLSGFTYNQGAGPSSEQTFSVSGINLISDVTITASANYEISTTAGVGYASPLILAPSSGTLVSTTIYGRLKSGLSTGTYNSEIINITATGSTTQTVTCNGTVAGPLVPVLAIGSLAGFGNVNINTTAGPNSFTITGTDLTADPVIIGALNGFTYSATAGGTYTSTLSIPQPGGAFSTTIYIKFSPLLVQSYNGNIIVGGGGAPSVNCAATGSGVNIVPIFQFTFEDVLTPIVDNAAGVPSFTSVGVGGLNFNATTPCESTKMYQGSFWTTGDYYQFTVNTTGYSALTFSYCERGSNVLIGTFHVRVSTDGTNWTTVLADNVPSLTNITQTTSLFPLACENAPVVYIQIYKTSAATSTGQSTRIDNAILTGTPETVPPVATFNPPNGSTGVLINVTPTITFNEPVQKTNGTAITSGDLLTLVTLKTTNASGTDVPFTASIDATNTIITVTPTALLSNSQLYYYSIGAVEDVTGNESGVQNATFTTMAPVTNNDATLSDLKVDGTTVVGFTPSTYSYNVELPYGTTVVPTVTATPNYGMATLLITPPAALPGTTTVLVTAQDGVTQLTYNVIFTLAAPSTDASLSILKWVPFGAIQSVLVTGFNTTTYNYTVEIPAEITTVTLSGTTTHSGASTVITHPSNLAGTLAQRTGTIVITAQDGSTTKTYTVVFSVVSGVAYHFKEGFTTFPPANWTYTGNISNSTSNGVGIFAPGLSSPKFKWTTPTDGGILISPTCNTASILTFYIRVLDNNPASQLHLYIEKSTNGGADWTLLSADPMPMTGSTTLWHQVIVPVNDNSPTVNVRLRGSAITGTTATGLFYVDDISLTMNSNADANLSDLKVSGTTIPGFSPNILTYNYLLPVGTTIVPTVTATTTQPSSTILITNAAGLPGATTVKVTAPDGVTTLTYTINFSVTLSSPTNLTTTQIPAGNVNLNWADNSSGEDGFIIERKPTGGLYAQVGSVGSNVTSYSDGVPGKVPNDFIPADRFAAVTVTSGVKFADVTNYKGIPTSLYLDVYQPTGDPALARPVIIWIHGGGFRTDSYRTQGYIVDYSTRFAKRGYVCMSIDYRLREAIDMPTQASEFPALQDAARDANAAINWIKANAATYNIDPNLIFIAGGSAGGRTTQTVCQFDGPDPTALYAPENLYLTTLWDKTSLIANATLWGGLEPEMRGWVYPSPPYSTANYLQATDVPTILVHGDADVTILPQNSIDLNNALLATGVTSELHIIPGATHSCLGKETEISAWVAAFFAQEWNKVYASPVSYTYRVKAINTIGNSAYSNESGWPKAENATATGFTAKTNLNVPGTSYFVVLPTGATAPTSAQVKAGQNASGTSLATNLKGSIASIAGNTEYLSNVTGLASLTTYDVYFVAENTTSELQSFPTLVTVTTLAPDPEIVISPSAITGFNYILGSGPSTEQTFIVSGSYLTNSISIAASANYEISSTSGGGYASPISLVPTSGTVNNTTIYVRLKAGLSAGTYNNEIINVTSTGAIAKMVTCSGQVINPVLSVGTLSGFGNVCINTTAGPSSFAITGTDLNTANVTVAALPGFTYSTTSGGTYSASLSIPQTGGAFSATIYVKFSPTLVQSYNGNIAVSGGGAPTVNCAATGSGINTPPAVSTTNPATSVTGTSATCSGNVTDAGCATITTRGICYGTSLNPDISGLKSIETGTTGAFASNLPGLTPVTTYHFRAYATSSAGTSYGSDFTFTTLAVVPTVTTNAASAISSVGGTLNGTVNANNSSTVVTFEYGTTISYGTTVTAVPSPVTGTSNTAVSYILGGLQPNTTYHFRVKGANIAGSVDGNDMTFTTTATSPTVVTNAATTVGSVTAILNGTVNANNQSSTVTFQYGTTIAYGSTVNAVPFTVTGFATTQVLANISGLTGNTTYHFRVVATNATGTSYGNDLTFTTNCVLPDPAGTISGPNTVCQTTSGVVYSVGTIAQATSYVWAVPAGAIIASGNGTNSIIVNYSGTAVSGNVTVYGTSTCGNGGSSSLPVTVSSRPTPTISGAAVTCTMTSNNTYSTESGMSGYSWTVSSGGIITSGAGTNSITVTWNTSGAKTVTVNYNNAGGCASLTPAIFNVTVNTLPNPTISGQNQVCAGVSGVVYTTEAGFSNYVWTISYGGTITSGLNSNEVTVNWATAGTRTIWVNYSNALGCSASQATGYSVTVLSAPIPIIVGAVEVCEGTSGVTYTTQPNNTNYEWVVSAGGLITSGFGTNSIIVTWNGSGSQTVSVNYSNTLGCNASSPTLINVMVEPKPAAAGTISGQTPVCAGTSNVVYSVAAIANATSYGWTVPPGAIIVSGAGTNSISVDFTNSATSGNIKVYGTNDCGNGATSPNFNLIVNPIPVAPFITQHGDTLISSANTGNQWYLDGVVIPGATDKQHIAVYTGYYTVVVALNGCSSSVSNSILVLPVSINKAEISRIMDIYPNPNNGQFTIKAESLKSEECTIEIYNNMGTLVRKLEAVSINGSLSRHVDLEGFPSGVYTVALRNNTDSIVKKIIIMN